MDNSKPGYLTKWFLPDLLVIITSIAWFSWLSVNRLIARDEGFYTLAAKLITEGKQLYLDFFFPQGPLSAYIYALGFEISAPDWATARLVAALFASGTAYLVWQICSRKAGIIYGLFAFLSTALCNLFFCWVTTAQSYPLCIFFLLLGFSLLQAEKISALKLFLAGLFLCFAGLVRIYLFGLTPLALAYICFVHREKLLKNCVIFLSGLFLPLVVFAFIYKDYASIIYFNLFDYHLLRSSQTFAEALPQKQKIIGVVTGFLPTVKFTAVQFPFLILIATGLGFINLLRHRSCSIWLLVALTLMVISLIPTPPYVQYFCLIVPFASIALFNELNKLLPFDNSNLRAPVCFLLLLGLYFYSQDVSDDVERYTRSGRGVIGVNNPRGARIWNIEYVKKVSKSLDSKIDNNALVFSFWPGYLLETNTKAVPGFENHFAIRIADKVSTAERELYKIGSAGMLKKTFADPNLQAIMLDPNNISQQLNEKLVNSSFKLDSTIAFPATYVRKIPAN